MTKIWRKCKINITNHRKFLPGVELTLEKIAKLTMDPIVPPKHRRTYISYRAPPQ